MPGTPFRRRRNVAGTIVGSDGGWSFNATNSASESIVSVSAILSPKVMNDGAINL